MYSMQATEACAPRTPRKRSGARHEDNRIRGQRRSYISSIQDAKWHEDARDPRAVKFVLLHPFIALILSHHSSAETSTIRKAVSDALNVFYGQMGKIYEDAKEEQDKPIDYILTMAEFNHIPMVKEKLREQLKQGLPKAFKIMDKLLPDNSKEHAILLRKALDYDVKNEIMK